jgi:hypothetical protein
VAGRCKAGDDYCRPADAQHGRLCLRAERPCAVRVLPTSDCVYPIVCITGTDATDEQIESGGFASVLRKPTTLADVMLAIDEVTATLMPSNG